VSARRGFTLLEVSVATLVLATAVAALQTLVARSVDTVDRNARRARTLVAARALLAEAELAAPAPGRARGVRTDGLRFEREVTPTPHPALVQVRVRVESPAGGDATELVELVHAPRP
jgi:prepilin-type N-terminal cleavage/methylation domain-containing protein